MTNPPPDFVACGLFGSRMLIATTSHMPYMTEMKKQRKKVVFGGLLKYVRKASKVMAWVTKEDF